MRIAFILLTWLALIQLPLWSQQSVTNSASTGPDTPDGWPDLSRFLDQKYGFLPIAMPITEPAVGYGAAGGMAFISEPLGGTEGSLSRPNITMVGGMGTENGSWGAVAGDMRYWLDDRLQTLAGVVYSSINLDFHGIGEDNRLADDPLGYNLEPIGGMLQTRYRLGKSRWWAGLSYAYATTEVTFEAPEGTPGLPEFQAESNVGSVTPSLAFDTRDNLFTPSRGSYLELAGALASEAFGSDGEFQRLRLIGMQYFELHPAWHLGFRGEAASSFGNIPFYLRPFLYMRGAPAMRYQGEDMAQIEAELRWQFWERFSAVGFGGVGAVWNDFERFDNSDSAVTGGFGFRYELARKYGIHAGLDVAFGPDNTAVYVQFGSAWMRP